MVLGYNGSGGFDPPGTINSSMSLPRPMHDAEKETQKLVFWELRVCVVCVCVIAVCVFILTCIFIYIYYFEIYVYTIIF